MTLVGGGSHQPDIYKTTPLNYRYIDQPPLSIWGWESDWIVWLSNRLFSSSLRVPQLMVGVEKNKDCGLEEGRKLNMSSPILRVSGCNH